MYPIVRYVGDQIAQAAINRGVDSIIDSGAGVGFGPYGVRDLPLETPQQIEDRLNYREFLRQQNILRRETGATGGTFRRTTGGVVQTNIPMEVLGGRRTTRWIGTRGGAGFRARSSGYRGFPQRVYGRRRMRRKTYNARKGIARANRNKGRAIVIRQPSHGVPPRMMVKLSRTITTATLSPGAAFAVVLRVRANSLSDTFLAHGTGTLYGVPAFSAMYDRYRVHASKCTVWAINNTASADITTTNHASFDGAFVLRPERVSPVADNSPASMDEAHGYPNTVYGHCPVWTTLTTAATSNFSPTGPMRWTKRSMYRKTKRMYAVENIDSLSFIGNTSVEPPYVFDWVIYAGSTLAATSTLDFVFRVRLDFWVEFFQRNEGTTTDFS